MGGIIMGGVSAYLDTGGFSEYLYHQVGDVISANGVSGKVLAKEGDDRSHEGLPTYSNTSEVYFKLKEYTNIVEQARIYKDRQAVLDFDWGHDHHEFKEGVVHVHEWYKNKNGKWVRSSKARHLNNEEMKKYGDLLKKANPNIKFR